ncbi:hypothetical protein Tco_1290543, partial [Tanacetum coccineum]
DSIGERDVDLEKDQEEDVDDGDIFYMWNITVKDVERIRQFLTPNVLDVMDDIIQPLIPKTIHTTPPDEDYVAPTTKSILDDLFEEFRYEILNVTMVDEGVECSHTKDLEELERLLAKDPQSHYTEIQVHSIIINPEPFIHTQLMSPLYGVFNTSKPCKVDKDIISPGRYDFYSSFPYPVAYLYPNGVYCYFHPHLISSEGDRDCTYGFTPGGSSYNKGRILSLFALYLCGKVDAGCSIYGLYSDDELLEKWMLLEKADVEHVVSSSYRANPEESSVLILLLSLNFISFMYNRDIVRTK